MVDSSSIITASMTVFITIALGVVVRHLGWLRQDADESITRIIVNIFMPALILDKILGNPAMERLDNLLLAPAVGFGTIALGFLVSALALKVFPLARGEVARTFSMATGMYNYAYIPLPIIIALFDRETLGVLFLHNLGVDTAMWTLGLLILTGKVTQGGWHKIINAPVLGVIIGVVLTRLNLVPYLPKAGLEAIHGVGACAIPVALIMIGAIFRDLIRPQIFLVGRRVLALSIFLRMGLLPLVILGLMMVLPASLELKRVMVVQAAMPCAVFPVILARHYGGDIPTAIRISVATSALSILTTPLWIGLGLRWLG